MRSQLKKIRGLYSRGRYLLMAVLLAVTSILGSLPSVNLAHAAIGSVSQYSLPTAGSNLAFPNHNITLGPDGNIWYTASSPTTSNRVGKLTTSGSFTEYPSLIGGGSSAFSIIAGSDGNLWYVSATTTAKKIINITPTGTVLGQYSIPSGKVPRSMTLGPDGAVWFIGSGTIGKITTSGVVTEYSVATGDVSDITAGPDGNLWFTNGGSGSYNSWIGKITTSGVVTFYAVPTYNALAYGIAAGSDGNLWFTEAYGNKIGKITTGGVITEYVIPTSYAQSQSITLASDGALWFTERDRGNIGRITTAGVITEYSAPTGADSIITGPDGAVWFTIGLAQIGRMATELTSQAISFTSIAPTNANIDSADYTPTASSTSGLTVVITVDSSSSSVCSIDGSGKVSYQSAGTCTLNANQAGDLDYKPAAQVQQSFTVLPVNADTSVALDCPSAVSVGSIVTCIVTVTNDGPAVANDVNLTAVFPSSLASPSLSGGGSISGQTITWSTSSLASGASMTLTFSATAATAGKARFNAALVQTSPDPSMSNNIAEATIVAS